MPRDAEKSWLQVTRLLVPGGFTRFGKVDILTAA